MTDSMISISDLIAAAVRQIELETQVDELELELKRKKELLRLQSEEIIPSMMDELDMETFTLGNGSKISIKDDVRASIPEVSQFAAFNWLRQSNNDGIIKTQVVAQFGKGEDSEAERAAQVLTELGIHCSSKSTIHPQTLKAFIREELSKGHDIPLDLFGATVVKKTVIQLSK